jgi:hypothetical protein
MTEISCDLNDNLYLFSEIFLLNLHRFEIINTIACESEWNLIDMSRDE